MRLLSAHTVFTLNGPPLRNGIVAVADDGEILGVVDPASEEGRAYLRRPGLPETEPFDGFLCPGFINAHGHLELAHMKDKLSQGGGLMQFISEIVSRRSDAGPVQVIKAILRAEEEMRSNGIVGAGDICNTADTLEIKRGSAIRWHSFVEVFDIDPERAGDAFADGLKLAARFTDSLGSGTVSVTPHAPYSVSVQLLEKLDTCAYENGSLLSIHNQESAAEDEMFRDGRGAMYDLMKKFGLGAGRRLPTGFSSPASTLVHLQRCHRILLVHNTFTLPEDVDWVLRYTPQAWWCLCPNANRYIENRLPDISMLAGKVNDRIVIGTDSYASNTSLSILDELKTITAEFPQLPLDTLLRWSAKNGAGFFGWKDLGTLEAGKRPGINLLTGVDAAGGRLTASANVQPLVPAGNRLENAERHLAG
jgi:cytosine/adenosine deaminase-related metal-dependent hydrolase